MLRKIERRLKEDINKEPKLIDSFIENWSESPGSRSLNNQEMSKSIVESTPMAITPFMLYTLIAWALEGKKQGKGYGFPFDRTHLCFYERLKAIYSFLKRLKVNSTNQGNANTGKENKD